MSRRFSVAVHDLAMVAVAWELSYLVRYNFTLSDSVWMSSLQSMAFVIPAQAFVLWGTGLYRGVWRFSSVRDLWNIIRAAFVGTLAVGLVLFLANRLEGVPRATLVFYPLFLSLLLGAPRLIYRMWRDHGLNVRRAPGRKRVLILGAGRAGEMLARDMIRDEDYRPVAFLDDNSRLKGAKIHGIPVVGTIEELPDAASDLGAQVIVIAMPSATNAQMQRIVELCEQLDLPFRTLPRLHDLVSGRNALKALRQVAIEDLLGREPVSLDWRNISSGLAGKVVMVSGGGGSIGSELCRQIGKLGPQSVVLFEQSEFNLYSIELELRREFPNLVLDCFLGDVCDEAAVERAMSQYKPQVVFHAAAYKHVPMLQSNAREAVRNNILGTKILASAADKYGCATFVMISTDKAVNPANVMGASKRVAEVFCQTLNGRSSTRFITVRFGNVLGSAGSVVPLFQKQIASGGPVTVTHPKITRYFMTIPEACQLIMQAGVMGKGGEIFVLDMGEPVQVSYLAEQMIRLSGKIPGKDVEIVYTGLRPGEKLFEELFYDQENLASTGHEKILLAQSQEVDWERLNRDLDQLEEACQTYDQDRLLHLLRELVPGMNEPHEPASEPNVIALKRAKAS